MGKKKKLPAIVMIAIMTMITTFVWVGFEVYRALTKSPEISVDAEVIKALDPSLDVQSLTDMRDAVYLQDSDIGNTQFGTTPAPTETATGQPSSTPEATESASPTPTASASATPTSSATPTATPTGGTP